MEILQYGFMQRAIIAGLIVGFICPIMGMFIVLRRMSLIGDSLSHIALSGIAGAIILNSNPLVGSLTASTIASIVIEKLRKAYKQYADLSIAIIMAVGVGLSGILMSFAQDVNFDLFSFMYGSISTVTKEDILLIVFVGIVILLFIKLFYKELVYISFDEESARFSGIPVNLINNIFMILVAATITLTLRMVGVLLVSSLIALPVAASLQIAKSFKNAMFWSVLFGETSILFGIFASYYFDLAPGGAIVILSVIILILSAFYKNVTRNISGKKSMYENKALDTQ